VDQGNENAKKRQLLGWSNKVFFYTHTGRCTFSIRLQYDFHEEIDPESLKSAVRDALLLYPEFKIRVLYENGRFISEINDRPAPVFHGADQGNILGSDETNGYLFCFAYDKRTLTVSYYHGLSDVKGFLSFMNSMLFLYAEKTGKPLSQEETDELAGKIRLSQSDIPSDEEKSLDPYGWFSDENVCPKDLYESPGACMYPGLPFPDESDELNRHVIEFSLSGFLGLAKQYGVSAASLMMAIASRAFYEMEEIDRTKPVIAMLPVDLRAHIGADTMVNCSDGILVPAASEDFELSPEELCRKMKARIRTQVCRENFIKIITDKTNVIRSFEESGADPQTTAEENLRMLSSLEFQPFSYALTYPGSLNTGKGLDKMLRDIRYFVYAKANSFQGYTYNDRFRINIDCRNDNGSWAEQTARIIGELGLSVSMTAVGRVKGDVYSVTRV